MRQTPEEITERRLEIEAQRLMQVITISPDKPVVNVAKVEVTWQYPDEVEHSGHLIVKMPEDVDPWQEAREAAYAWLDELQEEAGGYLDYSSVDDIYAI